jgi:hypothetical protein
MAETSRLLMTIEKLLTFFEKDRFNLISGTLLLFSYILLRGLFEWTLFKPQNSLHIYVGLYNAYQAGFVFTLMFASGILVMALISRIKVRTITNVVLIGFVFSVMGPLIDSFIFGRTEGYEYVTLKDFSGAGTGLVFQLVLIGAFGGLYVAIKTESAKHAIATVAGLMGCMFFMGLIPTYIFEALQKYGFEPDERQAAVAVILFTLTVAAAALLVYVADRRIPGALLKKAHLKFTFLLLAISFVGLATAGNVFIQPVEGEAITIVTNDIPFALLLAITVLFAGQFLFSLDNIMKLQADPHSPKTDPLAPGGLTIPRYRQYAGFCAIISIGFAATLGPLPFLIAVIFILIGLMYHRFAGSPNRATTSIVTGLAGVLMFLTGFFTTTTKIKDTRLVAKPFEMRYPDHGTITLPSIAIIAAIGIFVIIAVLWFTMEKNRHKA